MMIPHTEGGVQEFNVSRRLFWGIFCLVLLSLCALGYYGISYHVSFTPDTELSSIEGENSALQVELHQFRRKMLALRAEVEDLSETDRLLRAWASLSRPGDEDSRFLAARNNKFCPQTVHSADICAHFSYWIIPSRLITYLI